MDWTGVLAVVAGLVGVVVGAILAARLSLSGAYVNWRREHLFELYVQTVPILRRLSGAVYLNSEETTQQALREMREILPRAEILCSPEALDALERAYSLLNSGGPKWWVTEEERAAHVRGRPLGSRSATTSTVDAILESMKRDLKMETGESRLLAVNKLRFRPGQRGRQRMG